MPNADPVFWTIAELRQAYRSGTLSPVEVTASFLDRIQRHDGSLHSYLSTSPDLALEQARDAERRYADSTSSLPPLLGIPLSIKDLFDVAGEPTTLGSRAFQGTTATHDSHVVGLLRSAGSVFLGKSNTAEFGQSATTANRLGPECGNPWDTSRTSGGSSGGAAAAVAAGLATASLGSDGGGSIRIPAAMCGLVGIKPTFTPLPPSDLFRAMTRFVCAGPIARSSADARELLAVQLGRDLSAQTRGPLRIGWCPAPEHRPVHPAIRAATAAAACRACRSATPGYPCCSHPRPRMTLPADWP